MLRNGCLVRRYDRKAEHFRTFASACLPTGDSAGQDVVGLGAAKPPIEIRP